MPPVSELDHAQGPAAADITLVEYGDYNSSQCAHVQPWIKALQGQMGDRLRYVFRHFPAPGLHPHAAEAAEAAGRQDRFWEMHDTLFSHYLALGNGFLVEYASDLGLNTRRFLRDMTQDVSLDRVRQDRISGEQSGVSETPTFFVNGVRQHGSWEGRDSWGESLLWEVGLLPCPAAFPKTVTSQHSADFDEESNVF
ncbi:MAG: DsbA family protein [Janthinobacterium lividum]